MPALVEWFDDLDAVGADAAGALDRGRQASIHDRLDWFRLTRAHILPEAKLAIGRARMGDTAAWLFLIETAPRRAAPLASLYTLRFAPVFAGDGERLWPTLIDAARARFDVLGLYPLAHPVATPGWRAFSDPVSTNWTIDVAGLDFAAYWASRPPKLRNTVHRRQHSHPVSIAIHRNFDPGVWAEYEAIYAESWKPREGSPAFLRALAEREAQAGTLRLGIARDGEGRALAAQFWLVERGVATIHKLAHRETAKAGSPGSLLSHAMFRAAIDDDGARRIDFGLGDEAYKADWMDTPRPMVRIDAYAPASLRGLAGIARETASRLARRRTAG